MILRVRSFSSLVAKPDLVIMSFLYPVGRDDKHVVLRTRQHLEHHIVEFETAAGPRAMGANDNQIVIPFLGFGQYPRDGRCSIPDSHFALDISRLKRGGSQIQVTAGEW